MPYIGNPPVTGDNNSFRTLDSISSYTQTFDGSSSSVVSTTNSTFTFTGHRFITGQRVTYSTTGTTIGGLSSGSVYYIIKVDQNTLKLASSYSNAITSNSITLTSLGVGSTHTLNVAFDGINTKFKATYNNGTKCLITRAAQLQLSINGVIQQPQDTTTPTNGFGIETDSNIIFSTPPAATDVFWGSLVATNFATFDISDNTIDSFTGTGSQTNFTLSKIPANSQNVLVTIDGVLQYPSDSTTSRAYTVNDNVIAFTSAPSNGSAIQVRHIGFAGATSSAVTGFYGRTGNVGLNTNDIIAVGSATIGVGSTSTSLLVQGNARITGILTIGTGSITLDGNSNTITGINTIQSPTISGLVTFSTGPVLIGGATSTGTANQDLQVYGNSYIQDSLGIGNTNPTSILHIGSGTTVIAPLKINSGSVLTTPQAGTIEYDGTTFYATPNTTSGRGILPSQSYYRVGNTSIVGNTGTSAQNVFGSLLTVNSSTVYQFEYICTLRKTAGANTHNVVFRFLNGTATVNNVMAHRLLFASPAYDATIFQGLTLTYTSTFAYNNVAIASMDIVVIVRGTVGIATGGTIGPQYTLSTNPGGAYSTLSGSYFSIWPIGIGTGNISVGQWA